MIPEHHDCIGAITRRMRAAKSDAPVPAGGVAFT